MNQQIINGIFGLCVSLMIFSEFAYADPSAPVAAPVGSSATNGSVTSTKVDLSNTLPANDPNSYKTVTKNLAEQLFPVAVKNLSDLNNPNKNAWQGWPVSSDLLDRWKSGSDAPVFLDTTDSASGTYSDWNGLNASIEFAQGSHSSEARSFILVAIKSDRGRYYSYAPDNNGSYDLSLPPVKRVFTRDQEVKHWNQLPAERTGVGGFIRDTKRFEYLIGFSPNGFKVGSTTSSPSDANSTFYFAGGAYSLNPYAAFNAGLSTGDGHKFYPSIGFNLDVSIISQIFGSGGK